MTNVEEFPWFSVNEKRNVRIIKPVQTIMKNWVLCEDEAGAQAFVPQSELEERFKE